MMVLTWPGLVMALAAAGSGAAAVRAGQPSALRLAHTVMAGAMMSMLLPAGRRLSVIVLAALGIAIGLTLGRVVRHPELRQREVHRSGLTCAVDLAGMALVLTVFTFTGARSVIVVLLALAWAVSSLWAHLEVALMTTTTTSSLVLEAMTAVAGAAAMASMSAMMT